MTTSIQYYIELLNEELDSRFPNTTRFAISGGDFVQNWVMELRDGDCRLQYRPYELFTNANGNYEDSVLELCNTWEKVMHDHWAAE